MVERIELVFPRFQGTDWRVSSKPDDRYNCIAWAAEACTDWWWPVGPGPTYWPEGAPCEVTQEAFCSAFATFRYVLCASEELEQDVQKIALFANDLGVPTHAARQLESGRWTSKLGKLEDIEHSLHDLEGAVYGSVVRIVKRPKGAAGAR